MSANTKTLKIIALNANSLASNRKKYALKTFINEQKPDIMMLSETNLTNDDKLFIKHYKIIRNDSINQKRGTAIVIKNNIRFNPIDITAKTNFKCIETTTITLKTSVNENIILTSLYGSHHNKHLFMSEYQKLYDTLKLSHPNNFFVISGDHNAKHKSWKNESNESRGNTLYEWLTKNGLINKTKLYHSKEPTYPRTGSYLDLTIADTRLNFNKNYLDTIEFDSDHRAISFQITLPNNDTIFYCEPNETTFFNYKKARWSLFQLEIERNTAQLPSNRNLTNLEIDEAIEHLNENIISCMERTIPKQNLTDTIKDYDNHIIKKLQKKKSTLISTLHCMYRLGTNRDDNEIKRTKSLIKNVNSLIQQNLKNVINQHWKNKVRNIIPNSNMFPSLNKLFRKKESMNIKSLNVNENELENFNITIPQNSEKDSNNNYNIKDNKTIAHILGTTFKNKHALNESCNAEHTNCIKDTITQFQIVNQTENFKIHNFNNNLNAETIATNQTNEEYFTSPEELNDIIKSLKNKKSAGPDEIPNIVLKHLPYKILIFLTIVLNNAINNCYFPKNWKKAKVIALKKPSKDPSSANSYRPISLLPTLSKVFEKIIKAAIIKNLDQQNILEDNQFGFRTNHSTIHATNKFTSDICWNLNNNYCVGTLFIDLTDAFTTIWTEGLISKLISLNFAKHLIILIKNMIEHRCFTMSVNGYKSDQIFGIKNGLQQGTVCSPILFIIYINDLLKKLNTMPNNFCKKYSLAFADDLTIYVAGRKLSDIENELSEMFETTRDYINSWNLSINYNKCELVLFRKNLRHCHTSVQRNWRQFHIRAANNFIIQTSPKVRYLGILYKPNLDFHCNVKNQIQKAHKAFGIASKLFYSKDLHPRVKIIAYQSLIRPIIAYGCQTWYNISASVMEEFRVFERKCLRACLNKYRKSETDYKHYISNEKIYNEANIIRFDNFIISMVRKFYNRAAMVKTNSLIYHPAFTEDIYIQNTMASGYIPPEGFLFLDKHGFIQNHDKIPILYHHNRRATDRS
jgi:hypothetical protein